MNTRNIICLDVGGTWIKGALINNGECSSASTLYQAILSAECKKTASPLCPTCSHREFLDSLTQLISKINPEGQPISAIAIATAGVVDFAGKKLDIAAPHLSILCEDTWIEELKRIYPIPISLINDSDAVAIGAAAKGYLCGYKTIGIMPIGTGLGFTLWRNGRKWTPHFSYTLLGAIETPSGSYDAIASASKLAARDKHGELERIFCEKENSDILLNYLDGLAGIIRSANTLYHVDSILIGGGLANATHAANYDLAAALNTRLAKTPALYGSINIQVLSEGNALALYGAALIASGEAHANAGRHKRPYTAFKTESPYKPELELHKAPTQQLVSTLWQAEQEAGQNLQPSLAKIAEVADIIAEQLRQGGRLIYVGCGTSGRLAAIDTVEIACTFGFPRERVLCFIAGGVADAAIDIEMRFEEDASAVPELLMANLSAKDIVVGVSVSGSAYYVQSALGYAQSIGAPTIIIQEHEMETLPFCKHIIPLHSGSEVIAGSTRMKAGTATKKVINFLSTTAMIRLGKVTGCYMTEVECLNEKLVARAQNILKLLYNLEHEDALRLLDVNGMHLNRAIASLEARGKNSTDDLH